MRELSLIIIGWTAGLIFGTALIHISLEVRGVGQNVCRAENPGYDCVIGYVRGAPFQ